MIRPRWTFVLIFLGINSAVLTAQQTNNGRHWQAALGATVMGLGDSEDWVFGPEFAIRAMASSRVGIELRATWLMTRTDANDFSGIMGRLGTVVAWQGRRQTIGVSAGLIAATLVTESFVAPGATSRASAVGVYAEASGT